MWGMGGGVWGMGDWGMGPIPNPQSPNPNPQSPFDYLNFNSLINKFKLKKFN